MLPIVAPINFGGAHAINAYSPPSSLLYSLLAFAILGFYRDGVTKVFTQEGFVTDVDNRPMTGVHSITIRLYQSAEGEQPFYEETHNNIAFTDGRYAVAVGSINPLDWPDFTGNVWLGMSIDVGPELLQGWAWASLVHLWLKSLFKSYLAPYSISGNWP